LLSHFLLLFLLIRKLGREHELTNLKLLLPLQEECSASACGLDKGVIGLAERLNPITQHSICATELIAIQTPFGSYTPSFRAQFFFFNTTCQEANPRSEFPKIAAPLTR
jgi:hypothetical protein